MKQETSTTQVASAVNEGWMQGGSFLSSILSGTLLGYLLDMWLGTDPWMVVIGVGLGSYAGFVKVWGYMKQLDDTPHER